MIDPLDHGGLVSLADEWRVRGMWVAVSQRCSTFPK